MSRMACSWNGGELARALRQMPEAVSKKTVTEALTRSAEPIRSRMQTNAPRAPGLPDLADHIVVSPAKKVDGERLDASEVAVAIGPRRDFFYGRFLEFGTVHISARPFARPAFDAGVTQSLSMLGGHLWTAIKKQADRGASASGTGTL